jgi:hypothetical protein
MPTKLELIKRKNDLELLIKIERAEHDIQLKRKNKLIKELRKEICRINRKFILYFNKELYSDSSDEDLYTVDTTEVNYNDESSDDDKKMTD